MDKNFLAILADLDNPVPMTSKCSHGKTVRYCIECNPNPSMFCLEHRTRKYQCKKCKVGIHICKHEEVKYTCSKCKDSIIKCIHGNQKYSCQECEADKAFWSEIKGPPRKRPLAYEPNCPHGKKTVYCMDCNPDPKLFCLVHRRGKNICTECKKSQI